MKGLILNNIYSVKDSILLSIIIIVVVNILLILSQEPQALRIAAFFPFALITVNAFEALKQDMMSGWSKYELTLPIEKYKIVLSKYVTIIFLIIISFIITGGLIYISSFFITIQENIVANFMIRAIGIVLGLSAFIYPLTYILGDDKSEVIRIVSIASSLVVFGVVYAILMPFQNKLEQFDNIFSYIYLVVSVILFIISYIISVISYKRKEFS